MSHTGKSAAVPGGSGEPLDWGVIRRGMAWQVSFHKDCLKCTHAVCPGARRQAGQQVERLGRGALPRGWWLGLRQWQQEGKEEVRLESYLRRQVLKMNGRGHTNREERILNFPVVYPETRTKSEDLI